MLFVYPVLFFLAFGCWLVSAFINDNGGALVHHGGGEVAAAASFFRHQPSQCSRNSAVVIRVEPSRSQVDLLKRPFACRELQMFGGGVERRRPLTPSCWTAAAVGQRGGSSCSLPFGGGAASSTGFNNGAAAAAGHSNAGYHLRADATKLNAAVLLDTNPLTTVEKMRQVYGPRRNWWGDLTAQQTRHFYHELLPVKMLMEANSQLSLEERARIASMARHAARMYARERCALPSRIAAHLFDGFRHFQSYGTWSWSGLTWNEVWDKYERQVRAELTHKPIAITVTEGMTMEAEASARELLMREMVCKRILEKSCSTNKMVDKLSGMPPEQCAHRRSEREKIIMRMLKVLVSRSICNVQRMTKKKLSKSILTSSPSNTRAGASPEPAPCH